MIYGQMSHDKTPYLITCEKPDELAAFDDRSDSDDVGIYELVRRVRIKRLVEVKDAPKR